MVLLLFFKIIYQVSLFFGCHIQSVRQVEYLLECSHYAENCFMECWILPYKKELSIFRRGKLQIFARNQSIFCIFYNFVSFPPPNISLISLKYSSRTSEDASKYIPYLKQLNEKSWSTFMQDNKNSQTLNIVTLGYENKNENVFR